ncbi:NAD(P)-dependent oxidoreductase [Bergeyella zoohelcum]|uniref:Phosphoglycerate dehydrogenase n=1 Tax=Bergeyella zoohelcum ATCC 43767 TaxID=883096 RepID=K1M319_9FLAO|nr:NAD(P)-dependent oxidoreductase [Bergeyella zoohelcum]EKB58672.1 hypothetical protein HMPREF9699_00572 [Bergeyella zoohelcum ATCC 43767]SUV49238.1 D-3-phosphoglycerate dehydrogenase [Bergeyella zoohelcum]
MKILQLDSNHHVLKNRLEQHGCIVEDDFHSDYQSVLDKINDYQGIIIRSRIPIDENFLLNSNLKFIARVGAGMENIHIETAKLKGITLINSPEGNRDAVAEHVLGMLLLLVHRLEIASHEVKNGIWLREENRGDELMGKTVGIIGYGNMGKATAKRCSGFGCKVIFHDILPHLEDAYATQVDMETLYSQADIVSLHVPLTESTHYLVDENFIAKMKKPFYLINTARGKNVKTSAVASALKSGKIKAVGLDVLEYEKSSFENLDHLSEELQYLLSSEKALITPHIAGWTHQSKIKMAEIIAEKIIDQLGE